MSAEPRYTSAQLLEAAAATGKPVSARLLDDWVRVGLLDRPARKGLGRGKGSLATWPETQLKLFLATLDRRRAGAVKQQATLCNVPIFIWLNWGEEYVPLRQVRRALSTWIKAHRRGSLRGGRHSARLVVEQIQHPDSSKADRKALIDQIALVANRGRVDPGHREEMLRLLGAVHEPPGAKRSAGLTDATPETWLFAVEAQMAATKRFGDLTDEHYELARAMHLSTLRQWHARRDGIKLPVPTWQHLEHQELEERANRACQDLLLGLGMQILEKERKDGE